jgi:DNA-binding transcriptional ArsR family regulator
VTRRWAPPKPKTPQQDLRLEQRGLFTPAAKSATDTSAAAAASVGLKRGGDSMETIGALAGGLIGAIERHTRKTRLSGVLRALKVRGEVLAYLEDHEATADEIAYVLKYSILTVRPRVSELNKMGLITDTEKRRANTSGRMAIVWRRKADG